MSRGRSSNRVIGRTISGRVAAAHACAISECETARVRRRRAGELRRQTRTLRFARVGPRFRVFAMDLASTPEVAIDVIRVGDHIVVSIRGELDIASRAQLDAERITIDGPSVAVDIGGVTFCDVAGLDALHRFVARLADGGDAEVHLVGASPALDRIVHLIDDM